MIIKNNSYEIMAASGEFVDFYGIVKSTKNEAFLVTLKNGYSIIVGLDHIFFAGTQEMYASSLVPHVSYITTDKGDIYVEAVEKIEMADDDDFYDIIDSKDYEYIANGISNHNCSFLGSGDNFINEERIQYMEENTVKKPIRLEFSDRKMWIYEDPEPNKEYIMTLDVSSGHGDDYSALNMLKIEQLVEQKEIIKNGKVKNVKIKKYKIEQVAEYYGKITPQVFASIGCQYGIRYNHAACIVDVTGGYGAQCVDSMMQMGYDNMFYTEVTHKATRERLDGYVKIGTRTNSEGKIVNVDLLPGFYIGNNRAQILIEFQRAINMNDVIIRSSRLVDELKTFVNVGGSRLADHKRTFHDDSIFSIAIGLFNINFVIGKFNNSSEKTKKMLDAMINLRKQNLNEMTAEQENLLKEKRLKQQAFNGNNSIHNYSAYSWLFKK